HYSNVTLWFVAIVHMLIIVLDLFVWMQRIQKALEKEGDQRLDSNDDNKDRVKTGQNSLDLDSKSKDVMALSPRRVSKLRRKSALSHKPTPPTTESGASTGSTTPGPQKKSIKTSRS